MTTPDQPPSVMSGQAAFVELERILDKLAGCDLATEHQYENRWLACQDKKAWNALAAEIARRAVEVYARDLIIANTQLSAANATIARLREALEHIATLPRDAFIGQGMRLPASIARQALETEER